MALQYQGYTNQPLGGGLEDFFSPFFTGGWAATVCRWGAGESRASGSAVDQHGMWRKCAALFAMNPD